MLPALPSAWLTDWPRGGRPDAPAEASRLATQPGTNPDDRLEDTEPVQAALVR